MIKIINKTKGDISVIESNGCTIEYLSVGEPVTLDKSKYKINEVNGINIYSLIKNCTINLPEYKNSIYYIVDIEVAMYLIDYNRNDLLIKGDYIFDNMGKIIACNGLISLKGII